MSGERTLVPVAPSATLRETVEYVVDSSLAAAAPVEDATDSGAADVASADADAPDAAVADSPTPDAPDRPVIHFVYVHGPAEFDPDEELPELEDAQELLERVAVWVEEDAGGEDLVDVRIDHVGEDRYLFSPGDVAGALLEVAREDGADRIVVDPEYDPGIGAPLLRPLEYELTRAGDVAVEEAPVRLSVRRRPLAGGTNARRFGALVGLSFVFYQLLAGGLSAFDLATGAVVAIVVGLSLSRVSLGRDPSLRRTPMRALRGAVYLPYLFWEIFRANVAVAAVILNPRGEIDPQTTRIRPAVYGSLPVTTLANSITLTPGTLTVRVRGRELLVHTLLEGAREDLFDGGLERAVRFVFYGRRGLRIDGLADRGAAEVVPSGEVLAWDEERAEPTADSAPGDAAEPTDDDRGGEQ